MTKRFRMIAGPNAAPNAPQAQDTSPIIPEQLGLDAIINATPEITVIMILPAQSISWFDAFFLNIGL